MVVKSNRSTVVRQILESHSLFGSLDPAELDQLAAHARTQTYVARQTIFEKGSPGLGLLAVLKGQVRISSLGRDGNQVVLNIINEGDVFGEIALLDGKDRTADATAIGDCELLSIDRRDFVPFVRANPEVALRLLSVMCGRLRRTTEQVEDLIFLDAPSRLAKKLLAIADTSGNSRTVDNASIVAMSQNELGKMTGLTRETVNKHLTTWQQAGILKLGHGSITVLDPAALRKQCE